MTATVSSYLLLQHPIETELLVVVFDLTNFAPFSRSRESAEVFEKQKAFSLSSFKAVKESNGIVLKFIGDSCLAIFPIEEASNAIVSMSKFKTQIDLWLEKNIPGSHLAVNCHVGPVTIGPMPGFNGQNQIDIVGTTLVTCFRLGSKGFTISPQAFRTLTPEARKQFKKFTPPITYNLDLN